MRRMLRTITEAQGSLRIVIASCQARRNMNETQPQVHLCIMNDWKSGMCITSITVVHTHLRYSLEPEARPQADDTGLGLAKWTIDRERTEYVRKQRPSWTGARHNLIEYNSKLWYMGIYRDIDEIWSVRVEEGFVFLNGDRILRGGFPGRLGYCTYS